MAWEETRRRIAEWRNVNYASLFVWAFATDAGASTQSLSLPQSYTRNVWDCLTHFSLVR